MSKAMSRQALLALQFLTVLPVPDTSAVSEGDLPRSMGFYPFIGALIGALAGLTGLACAAFFPVPVAAAATVAALAAISGALHLDGLADTCDGFYGGGDRERVLAVMKDSRSGAMAVIGVSCALLAKFALLSGLGAVSALPALIAAGTLSRASMVWLCHRSTYARCVTGTGSPYIGRVAAGTALFAAAVAAAIAIAVSPWRSAVAIIIVAVSAELYRWRVEARIDGMTGDTLGAACELSEIIVLLVFAASGGLRA
jgi:adenosylcobinamide-GDP ribazoletransferase